MTANDFLYEAHKRGWVIEDNCFKGTPHAYKSFQCAPRPEKDRDSVDVVLQPYGSVGQGYVEASLRGAYAGQWHEFKVYALDVEEALKDLDIIAARLVRLWDML